MSDFGPLTSIVRSTESRLANPIVARVLRSRLHPVLSLWLLLLYYEGRRSGRRYATPALYRRTDRGVDLITPADSTNWCRNFRGGPLIDVLVRDEWQWSVGEIVTDEDVVVDHLRWLVGPIRRVGRGLGTTLPSDEWLNRTASSLVLVRVTFGEVPGGVDGEIERDPQ